MYGDSGEPDGEVADAERDLDVGGGESKEGEGKIDGQEEETVHSLNNTVDGSEVEAHVEQSVLFTSPSLCHVKTVAPGLVFVQQTPEDIDGNCPVEQSAGFGQAISGQSGIGARTGG